MKEKIEVEGNIERARELQHKLLILKRALVVVTYPGPVMDALHLIGKPGGYPRKPVLPVTKEQEAVIKDAVIAIRKL